MNDWKKAIIAFAPLLLGLWLIIGFIDNFKTATICTATAIVASAIVTAWIYFVFHLLDE